MNLVNSLNKSGVAVVSKATFFIKVTEIYMHHHMYDAELLLSHFSGPTVDLETLTGIVKSQHPDIPEEAIERLLGEAKGSNDSANVDSVVKAMLQYSVCVSSLGLFNILEVQSLLINTLLTNETPFHQSWKRLQ